ncbi:MAG: formate--tetrahydrofolate ligase [Spirochaetes bacterium]|nr:MAG: formate--tetrahydrofolate ligase [Spirochaetota bacterium]
MAFKSDLEIAQSATVRPIADIAAAYDVPEKAIINYGTEIAKIDPLLTDMKRAPKARYIDVTAITPTPLGEGKTTTTVGLTQGLGYIGKKAACAIRQPSMGPTFGIKGGAAGGGYSQIVPMEEFNLHLTGDIHAVSAAHNLGAAAIDARIYHEGRWGDKFLAKQGLERLSVDPYAVSWRRVLDMNDRSLRNVITGLGDMGDGPIRQTGFDIAVASELMAILALSKDLADMRRRIGSMVMARSKKGAALTAEALGVAGAMTVLMKDALKPNLLQTLEGQAAFVHAGPFANIAHGNSSVIADMVAARYSDYLVTESGFGSDIGMEKFFDIKCRASGLIPDTVVMVATVRALKMHGGGPKVTPGRALDKAYTEENTELLSAGLGNLRRHIENVALFGIPCVVAVNAFPTDTDAEHNLIIEASRKAGAFDAVVTTHHANGGEGAAALAEAVDKACDKGGDFRYLYDLKSSLTDKIEILADKIYRAGDVSYSSEAKDLLAQFETDGHGGLPICMAKTHLSLSHDPAMKNDPEGFTFPVSDARLSAGAGFVYPLAGNIRTMPGLGSKPAYMSIDIDPVTGKVSGLF